MDKRGKSNNRTCPLSSLDVYELDTIIDDSGPIDVRLIVRDINTQRIGTLDQGCSSDS